MVGVHQPLSTEHLVKPNHTPAHNTTTTTTTNPQDPPPGPVERRNLLHWSERVALTQPNLSTREPLLALRRQLAMLLGDRDEAGRCWLQQAKLCRWGGGRSSGCSLVGGALLLLLRAE